MAALVDPGAAGVDVGQLRRGGGHALKDMVAPAHRHPAASRRDRRRDGLAYTLWLPPAPPPPARAGVVIIHGADSCKESHHDFARAAVARAGRDRLRPARPRGERRRAGRAGDRGRGHDRGAAARGDRRPAMPRWPLRGSSMGGYLAIVAAPGRGRRRWWRSAPPAPTACGGPRRGPLRVRGRSAGLRALLDAHDLRGRPSAHRPAAAVARRGRRAGAGAAVARAGPGADAPGSRLIVVPGGHHRSIQHDEELQAVSLRFIGQALEPARGAR